jgi:hypothetical protein
LRVHELPIWRIEACHLLLMLSVLVILLPARMIDPWGFILGGLFMGINFILLTFGLRWTLAPFSQRGRIRTGVCLLVLKMAFFLGLISILFTRVRLDGVSFSAGVSCLLAAVLLERFWSLRGAGA